MNCSFRKKLPRQFRAGLNDLLNTNSFLNRKQPNHLFFIKNNFLVYKHVKTNYWDKHRLPWSVVKSSRWHLRIKKNISHYFTNGFRYKILGRFRSNVRFRFLANIFNSLKPIDTIIRLYISRWKKMQISICYLD